MKRGFSIFISAITALTALTAAADSKTDALLAQVSAKLKAMGEYEVVFAVSADAFKAAGKYVVSGSEYHLSLGDAEVFCDGTTRYEVNNSLQEITIDTVNLSERNILNNPVGGLDFLGEEFSAKILSQDAGSTVVRLTPVQNAGNSTIEVTVDNASQLPVRLVYRMAGDAVTIDLTSIRPSSAPLRRFDPKTYPDYEIIDFR